MLNEGMIVLNKVKEKLIYFLKHNETLLTVFSYTASFLFKTMGKIIKIDQSSILITANSMGYNDSPRVIFEEIVDRKEFDHLKIYWALNDQDSLPKRYRKRVTVIKPDTFLYFKIALGTKYWLSSVNIERGLNFKKKQTTFLNTWHGIPMKTVGNAVKGRNDFDWSKTNFICYTNEIEKEIYIRDFKANPNSMIASGLPRNDELYHVPKQRIETLKDKIGVKQDKKIILYAPTWRDSEDFGSNYNLDIPINWNMWKEELEDEFIILLRAHPNTTKLMNVYFDDFVMDMSNYPDINELYFVSDILISDYSSAIYDYSILERPIFCFAFDYEEYNQNRGLYFDLNREIPNGIVKNEFELISKLKTINYTKESEFTKKLKKSKMTYGGEASKKCIELLMKEEIYE